MRVKWPHRYHPSHGPQVWPWWRLLTVSVVRCGPGDPVQYFWLKGIAWNVWTYTRWGAWCWTITERRGVYRREEIDRRGWWKIEYTKTEKAWLKAKGWKP